MQSSRLFNEHSRMCFCRLQFNDGEDSFQGPFNGLLDIAPKEGSLKIVCRTPQSSSFVEYNIPLRNCCLTSSFAYMACPSCSHKSNTCLLGLGVLCPCPSISLLYMNLFLCLEVLNFPNEFYLGFPSRFHFLAHKRCPLTWIPSLLFSFFWLPLFSLLLCLGIRP